ncbi:MAG TPA: hypothetical protein VFH87_01695 [Candidatus Udaeobacter sp.]|nr:hypothetical protein [Candidatus Udaeobacter sp.]
MFKDFLDADIPNDGLAFILLAIFQIFALLLIFGPLAGGIWALWERAWGDALQFLFVTVIVWLCWFFPEEAWVVVVTLFSALLVLSIVTVLVYGILVFPAIKLYEILRGQ